MHGVFTYNVFMSHASEDKKVVGPVAAKSERLPT